MKVSYDAEFDVVKIIFSNVPVEQSQERTPGIICDYDQDGNIVRVEIMDASAWLNHRCLFARDGFLSYSHIDMN
jgi:uncharacterized protein YuzE